MIKRIIVIVKGLLNKIGFGKKPIVQRKPREKPDKGSFGQFTTIKSVLDSLDSMFQSMETLRPEKSDVQRIITRYGPYIGSFNMDDDSGDFIEKAFESGFNAYGLPSFLISYFNGEWAKDTYGDNMLSDFMVCTKTTKIPFFHKKKGHEYYDCTYVFLLPEDQSPHEIGFYIEVNMETAAIEAYPYLAELPHYVNGIKVCGKRGLFYPDLINDGENRNHADSERRRHLRDRFSVHYNLVMRREMGVNIIVKKGKKRATITVPPGRWKYFFKDRIPVPTSTGRNKPIFHAVMSHHRHLKNGAVSNIRTHYRGIRNFNWKGYSITIVLPGKHGVAQAELNMAYIGADDTVPENTIDGTSEKTADKINRLFEGIEGL